MQKNPQDYYIWRTKKDDKVSARIKTTDTPVQFLKLPETADNQEHNIPLIPIPSPKPKVTEPKTTTQKIVPVPTRKPLPANATLEQMLQRYILEHSPNLQQNLPQLNSTNS